MSVTGDNDNLPRPLADTIVYFKRRGSCAVIQHTAPKKLAAPGVCPFVIKGFVMHAAVKYVGALSACAALAFWGFVIVSEAQTAQDKYSLKIPGGLAFADFKGYESWQAISISKNDEVMALILGNPAMIAAFKSGIPGNGKPFPDGARMAKIHFNPTKNQYFPNTTVPGTQHDVDFMVKDSKQFADSGGWGYAVFEIDPATHTFRPGNTGDKPPQSNDAKCGAACHTIVKSKDYVFTDYAPR